MALIKLVLSTYVTQHAMQPFSQLGAKGLKPIASVVNEAGHQNAELFDNVLHFYVARL